MFKKFIVSIVLTFTIFIGVSLALIFSQDLISPDKLEASSSTGGLDFVSQTEGRGNLPPLRTYTARDGRALNYRFYESSTATDKLLILIHGSGWHSQQFLAMATFLSSNGIADVVTPDLRGHGAAPHRRGDLEYIGQFEDDISDLIEAFQHIYDIKTVILGGHSSGGGLVVRFAGGAYGKKIDAYLLLAPFLKYNAPTTRTNSGGWARPLTRRIIGLSMLNSVGVTSLNALPVIQFNMPATVRNGPLGDTATLDYSYRLNTSFAPRSDFEKDLAALKQPFFLLAGSDDEAFYADKYEDVISPHTSSGVYEIIPDLSHLQIVQDQSTHYLIADWISRVNKQAYE